MTTHVWSHRLWWYVRSRLCRFVHGELWEEESYGGARYWRCPLCEVVYLYDERKELPGL